MGEESDTVETMIHRVRQALRDKEGIGGRGLAGGLKTARRRLPRGIFRQLRKLAAAEELAAHPKLALTLDQPELLSAGRDILGYLERIDLADRRKGRWLGILGAVTFNLLAVVALFVAVLVWRGLL
jgi:hypothetical protein